MHKQIFVNLAVADLAAAKQFFGTLGFGFDERFTDEKAACMVMGENIYAMLLAKPYFETFTGGRPASDPRQSAQALLALPCDSRAEVDAMVQRALAAGGRAPRPPQDHGFMYQHGFDDLDGHIWEIFYMDMDALPQDMRGEGEG